MCSETYFLVSGKREKRSNINFLPKKLAYLRIFSYLSTRFCKMGNCVATCEIPDTNVPEIADLDITERQKKILELVEKNRSVNQP